MKIIRFFAIGFILCTFFLPLEANAQTKSEKVELPWELYIPCANGGLGEWASGTLVLHYVISGNKWHHQPMGSVLIGEDTGTVYRAAGVTQEQTINAGALVFTYTDVYHFVGPGIQFMERIISHITTVDGVPVVNVDKEDIICK